MEENLTEEALLVRYQTGDRRAFALLFARLAPQVHGFFMRSFGNSAVADDLLQTTFLNLHRARQSYRPSERVRPWVFAIAANVRLDELRRRYRLPAAASSEEVDRAIERESFNHQSPDPLEAAERAQQVRAALARLPESQRVVIELNRFEGLSFAEVARALGITEGAAKLRAFRGYELLRVSLVELGAPEGLA